MGMKTPYVSEIAPSTYAINEFGLSTMFLLEGTERAMLIDAGCGICDLEKVIRELTDKEYIVVLSHGHGDHIGAMGSFAQVYLNEQDWEMAKTIDWDVLRGFAEQSGKIGSYTIYDYSPENIKPAEKMPEFLPLNDGDTFDLGDRVIEAISIPGHTPGGMSFLDRKNRIMFSGDCCNINLGAMSASVETTLRSLRKFQSYAEHFDQNFNSHVGYFGRTDCLSQPKSVPDDLIQICEMVLNGTAQPQMIERGGKTVACVRYGHAKLSYLPDWLWDDVKE